MKRLAFIIISLCSMLSINAQILSSSKNYYGKQDYEEYLAGSVPEKDGHIVFEKTILSNKSKQELYKALQAFVSYRYQASTGYGEWKDQGFFNNGDYAKIREYNESKGYISCQGDEEIVFSSHPFSRDAAQLNYILDLDIQEGSVKATIAAIAYTYMFTQALEKQSAEELIADSEAINKKGKLYKKTAKFRIKTIDFVNQLFADIEKAL